MKKLFLLSAVFCILLTSCSGQATTPTALPSLSARPIFTPSLTPSLTSTPLPTVTPTNTLTPLPAYNTKEVIFDYIVTGDHSIYEMFFEPNFSHPEIRLVLYDDGQMIIPGKKYAQKVLSPDEINQFFSKLEALGVYSLESNQAHDPTDKLYNFGNNYERVYDAFLYCIRINTAKSRQLCVYEPGLPYLIPEMQKILEFLNEYEPTGMTAYYPDRMLLWVQLGRNPYDDQLPTNSIPWAEDLPSLETSKESFMYVDGDKAKEIYLLFGSTDEGKIFTQNGKEYTVYFDVIFPHETVTNAYQ